jgi:hypothetical protein
VLIARRHVGQMLGLQRAQMRGHHIAENLLILV